MTPLAVHSAINNNTTKWRRQQHRSVAAVPLSVVYIESRAWPGFIRLFSPGHEISVSKRFIYVSGGQGHDRLVTRISVWRTLAGGACTGRLTYNFGLTRVLYIYISIYIYIETPSYRAFYVWTMRHLDLDIWSIQHSASSIISQSVSTVQLDVQKLQDKCFIWWPLTQTSKLSCT